MNNYYTKDSLWLLIFLNFNQSEYYNLCPCKIILSKILSIMLLFYKIINKDKDRNSVDWQFERVLNQIDFFF